MDAKGATFFRPLFVNYNVSQGISRHAESTFGSFTPSAGLGSPGTRWEAVNGLSVSENLLSVSANGHYHLPACTEAGPVRRAFKSVYNLNF